MGHDHPDTYMFRTGEGTLGMLRIVGLSPRGQGMKIRYKLINPAKSFTVAPRFRGGFSEPFGKARDAIEGEISDL